MGRVRRAVHDGHPTETSMELSEVEASVLEAYLDRGIIDLNGQARFDFSKLPHVVEGVHLTYLRRALSGKTAAHSQALDHARPWMVYWSLHAMDLLSSSRPGGRSVLRQAARFLLACQHPDGGFSGCPARNTPAHLAPTYASVHALAILARMAEQEADVEALQLIRAQMDVQGLCRFLQTMKNADGSFRMAIDGETDTRAVYCAAAVYALIRSMLAQDSSHVGLFAGTQGFLERCQTYEGGLGAMPGCEAHGGYTYCGLAASCLLEAMDLEACLLDRAGILGWAAKRQLGLEGGFCGRTNKLVDGCYGFWVGALFELLGQDVFCEQRAKAYALAVCQNLIGGGFVDKPGKPRDLYHTCYVLSGLHVKTGAVCPMHNLTHAAIDAFARLIRASSPNRSGEDARDDVWEEVSDA